MGRVWGLIGEVRIVLRWSSIPIVSNANKIGAAWLCWSAWVRSTKRRRHGEGCGHSSKLLHAVMQCGGAGNTLVHLLTAGTGWPGAGPSRNWRGSLHGSLRGEWIWCGRPRSTIESPATTQQALEYWHVCLDYVFSQSWQACFVSVGGWEQYYKNISLYLMVTLGTNFKKHKQIVNKSVSFYIST